MRTKPIRSQIYMIRMTPDEAAALIALAEQRCSSGAAVLRQGLKKMAQEAGIAPVDEKWDGGTNSQARAAVQ